MGEVGCDVATSCHQLLPFVSVDGEKVFAVLRAVKTVLRSSLLEGPKSEHLNIAVRGMYAAKPVNSWNYDAVMKHYFGAKTRRVVKPRIIVRCTSGVRVAQIDATGVKQKRCRGPKGRGMVGKKRN